MGAVGGVCLPCASGSGLARDTVWNSSILLYFIPKLLSNVPLSGHDHDWVMSCWHNV